MQQGIKKLQWLEYLKVVFLKVLNTPLCRVFANQVTYEQATTALIEGHYATSVISSLVI